MRSTAVRPTVLVGALAVAGSLFVMAPAQSEDLASSRVTAVPSDSTPASGETFVVKGGVWSEGERVPATIRVKTYRNGEWVRLPGATMDTNRYNRYRIRIVLKMTGERDLRVVATPKDDDIARSRKDITVDVH